MQGFLVVWFWGVNIGALERHSFELFLQWLDGLRQAFEGNPVDLAR